MTTNIFQKKERHELMTRIFVLLIISFFLVLSMPPSFDFSQPEKTAEEKENYSGITGNLKNLNLSEFSSFIPIRPFKAEPGRPNPFLESDGEVTEDVEEYTEEEIINEEFTEEAEI